MPTRLVMPTWPVVRWVLSADDAATVLTSVAITAPLDAAVHDQLSTLTVSGTATGVSTITLDCGDVTDTVTVTAGVWTHDVALSQFDEGDLLITATAGDSSDSVTIYVEDTVPGITGLPGQAGAVAVADVSSPLIALPGNSTLAGVYAFPLDVDQDGVQSIGARLTFWDSADAGSVEVICTVEVASSVPSILSYSVQGTLPNGWEVVPVVQSDALRLNCTAGTGTSYWRARFWIDDVIASDTAGAVSPLPDVTPPSCSITTPSASWSVARGAYLYCGGTVTRGDGVPRTLSLLDELGSVVGTGVLAGDGTWGAHWQAVATAGSHTLRARVTDNLGEIGTSAAVSGTITASGWTPPPDSTPPTMTAFNAPAYSSSRTITLTTPPSATDAVGVTGYIVTVNDPVAPVAGASWGAAPATVVVLADGSMTLRAYARDAAGNISSASEDVCVVDTEVPVVTAFEAPASPPSTIVTLTTPPTATAGASGVRGYLVTVDTATVPGVGAAWASAPATVDCSTFGTHTLRAYAISNAGLVSAASTQTVTIVDVATFDDTFDGGTLNPAWSFYNGASATVSGGLMTRTDGSAYRGMFVQVPESDTDYQVTWVISHNVATAGYKGFAVRTTNDWWSRSGIQVFWATPGVIQLSDGSMYSEATNNITPSVSNGFPASWSVNQDHTVRIRCSGSTITVWIGTPGNEEEQLAWQFTSTTNQNTPDLYTGLTGEGGNATYARCTIAPV